MRKRVVFLSVLPPVVLGVTYFFLVEYVMREHGIGAPVAPILRYGGGGLILLFTLVAFACAAQISDGIARPLRALLRIAEGVDVPPGQTAYLPDADPGLRFLFLRVHTLVQQNRSGAQTLSELELLRKEVDELRRSFRTANEHREVPAMLGEEGQGPAGELTRELEGFWMRLRSDLMTVEQQLARLVRDLSERETAWATSSGEAEGALREVERLGTLWSLEVELARRQAPQMPGELGSCFREFTTALERLRGAVRSNGGATDAVAELRSEIVRLHETVGAWLPKEMQIEKEEESSTPMRGTE